MKKLFLALFIVFGLGLFINNNTYAVSDYVENISGVSGNQPILSNCDINCYQQYKYAIIEYTPVIDNYSFCVKANFVIGGITGYGKSFYLAHNSGFNIIDITGISSVLVGDGTFNSSAKITLTNDLPGSCPEPEEPDCPDPEENSQYMNVVLDSFWKYQAAFAGAVVAIIVIFIVFRLIKGALR